jgi:hypothetical protein
MGPAVATLNTTQLSGVRDTVVGLVTNTDPAGAAQLAAVPTDALAGVLTPVLSRIPPSGEFIAGLPQAIAQVYQHAYADGIALVFLIGVPIAVLGLIAVFLMKEVPLGFKSGIEQAAAEYAREAATADGLASADDAAPPVVPGRDQAPSGALREPVPEALEGQEPPPRDQGRTDDPVPVTEDKR